MGTRRFKGLYLQATGDPCCFSFVTYTPQTKEQMVACGDLDASDEYFNPVIFDFLLFASEAALGAPSGDSFPIKYDDVSIITSRKRGSGIQHEYLIRLSDQDWNDSKQSAIDQLQDVLMSEQWNGARLTDSRD
ncbi:hypothetical protein FZX09_00535 [Synechococcus sp. MU1643]|uniref:hypothetical protein n=1 Tax=Synechococcus sp. MU1643 TaxID=2508349 RepID=UPI001CF831EC|nr:hypothetical protein [Synechococcus sp. MU1643]MCB4427316.1 hypothetical protein [Synechococcus sp. MU1643]